MAGSPPTVCILGLPRSLEGRLQPRFRSGLNLRALFLGQKRWGRPELELPGERAKEVLEGIWDQADPDQLIIVELPYAQTHDAVRTSLEEMARLGTSIIRVAANEDGWPAKPPSGRLDQDFLDSLFARLEQLLTSYRVEVTSEESVEEREISLKILSGLAAKKKIGPNNHSHEDDLWKQRGQGLTRKQRKTIERGLIAKGVLAKKKNDSAGGKGWVYWIDDVGRATDLFPELKDYLS